MKTEAERKQRRAQEYDEMTACISGHLDSASDSLSSARYNRDVFIGERLSSVEQAGLALLEELATAMEELDNARRLLSLRLVNQAGAHVQRTADAARLATSTLYRWKNDTDEEMKGGSA